MLNHILVLLFISLCSLSLTASFSSNVTDHEALLAIKAATNDPSSFLSSWNSSLPFCRWRGITCSTMRPRVTGLNLANLTLSGSIPPHVGNLSFLRFLNLNNNSYAGSLPPELGRLTRIQHISLSNNLFEGELPGSLSNCSNLLSLVVSYNRLGGALPLELGSLSKLELLAISRNAFSGAIPSTLGNLSSLVRLYCGSNGLAGGLPASLGHLTRLQLLAFGENMITGLIPPSVFNLSKITVFDLAANQIRGSLPSNLGIVFPNLEFFSVGINMLQGSIPPSFSNATSLTYLHVGYNQFTGEVPSFMKLNKLTLLGISGNLLGRGGAEDLSFVASLKNSTNLASLGLDGNSFGGVLPPAFWNLSTTISRLFLSQNQISGTVSDDVGKFVELQDLRMNNNRFLGMIPSSIGRLQNLQFLDLSGNNFSSRIPSTIGNLSLLLYMYLSYNNFGSFIPSSIGNCQTLLEMNLSRNGLTGSLPKEVASIPSLRSIDLSQNQLNSTLPAEIGSLKNLEYFNVSRNGLVGSVPNSVGGCVRLEFLDLQRNSLQGNIPSSLSALRGLQVLDLSSNRFDGLVPEYLAEFTLLVLNLSFNDFEGALPQDGVFKNASAVSVAGNPKLCGGMPELRLPKCNLKHHKKSNLKLKIVMISTTLALAVIVGGALVFCCLKRRKPPPPSKPFDNSLLQVSYHTLSQATGGFSEESLLGAGSYGAVYRGALGEDEKHVAVKVLNLSQRGAVRSFVAECEALRNIRHRNLVKVVTACSGFDLEGNDFKALVYEFMPNGSLNDWLHPDPDEEDQRRGRARRLGLAQRLSIAIDVGCAVDYLHQQCATPIIHCDIKPSNVLLDDDLVGHVGDFGLARFLAKATTHQQSSSLIRGTIGYTAPEYGFGGEPTTSGDVYSFGILLLEMFSGRRPTDEMFRDGVGIHSFVGKCLVEEAKEVVDPWLLSEMEDAVRFSIGDGDQSFMEHHKLRQFVFEVLNVGVACSVESAKERMSISDAVGRLQSIRDCVVRETTNGR